MTRFAKLVKQFTNCADFDTFINRFMIANDMTLFEAMNDPDINRLMDFYQM